MPKFGRVRVFCLHLTLSHPQRVFTEFELAMNLRHDSAPSIICGDLNIIESARVAIINWLLGGGMRDVFAWKSLRAGIESRFENLKLQNPLRGKRTQDISRSQLDHILVPKDFRVAKAEVLQDRMGSDHYPIFVDCSPK
jgi:endonuclease/exonuclease/phosphatase family metal-dependent hydrolase